MGSKKSKEDLAQREAKRLAAKREAAAEAAGVNEIQPVVRQTLDERIAVGTAGRERLPLEQLATWEAPSDRPDPVGIIEAQDEDRIPEFVPIRHGRMGASAFAFYRGAAAIMASDLGPLPNTGIVTQVCGDAHLSNFGMFGTPERRLVFDLNDFDETVRGPWEWDARRLVASFAIATRERGLPEATQRESARAAAASYRHWMNRFADMPGIDVYYASLPMDLILEHIHDPEIRKRMIKGVEKTRSKTSIDAFGKLAQVVDGRWQIRSMPPDVYRVADFLDDERVALLSSSIESSLIEYRASLLPDRQKLLAQYQPVDVAFKVVGVGSVGTRALIALFVGTTHNDPLFLQIKEADESVWAPYAEPCEFSNMGERVVTGQRMMQAAADIFLGWSGGPSHDFYWRQLKDWKGSADIATMPPNAFQPYAEVCGVVLARAHARAGTPVEIDAYLGDDDGFDDAMEQFAMAYADQNEQDFVAFTDAIKSGRLESREG